jgi:hypothetical protein
MEPRADELRLAELQRREWPRGSGHRGTREHAAAANHPSTGGACDAKRRPVEFAAGWWLPEALRVPQRSSLPGPRSGHEK